MFCIVYTVYYSDVLYRNANTDGKLIKVGSVYLGEGALSKLHEIQQVSGNWNDLVGMLVERVLVRCTLLF